MTMQTRLETADQVDPQQLHHFLRRFFSAEKSDFLRQHGAWWHGGQENRWVLLLGDQIAGYCAVIPTRILAEGQNLPAIWWVDLVIAPEFRGQGLQSLFDEKIRGMDALKLGFPNLLAARIHRKHGWGVREDLKTWLLPLHPGKISAVRKAAGWKGVLLRLGSAGLAPLAGLARQFYRRYRSRCAFAIPDPDPADLAEIGSSCQPTPWVTTLRDEAFLNWRYFQAPYRQQLRFYGAGPEARPTCYLIARQMTHHGQKVTRILDVFGDFEDRASLDDLVRLAVSDAARSGSVQVTALASLAALKAAFRRAGFWISALSRFCWYTQDPQWMACFSEDSHWTLGDSDNDTLD